MNIMDDNPYKSPEAEPEPKKSPPRPPNRYLFPVLNGFMALGGVTMLQAVTVDTYYWVLDAKVLPLAEERRMLLVYTLIAIPVGALMAWWTLQAPGSKLPFVTAFLLVVGGFILAFIAVVFLGLP